MNNDKNNKIFIGIIISIIVIVMGWFPINHFLIHFGYKELHTTDNWVYFKYTKTDLVGKIEDFVEGKKISLQNRINNYFPFYMQLLKGFNEVNIKANKIFYKNNIPVGTNSSDEYIFYNSESEFYYAVNNHSDEDLHKRVIEQVDFFNSLSNTDKSVNLSIYLVPRFDQTGYGIRDLSNYTLEFEKGLNKNINVDILEIDSVDDYTTKFYKTDHHWNIFGALEGYKNIMNMLNKAPKNPDIIKVSQVPYYGSFAKSSLSTLTYDDIYDIDIDLKYNVLVNNQKPVEKFKPRNIKYNKSNKFFDYYIHYYDGQYGLVKYEFDNNKDNLLIIGDSYDWQIDYLIASHYKNTYVINLRYDEYATGKLEYNKFIKYNNITDVLFLFEGSATVFDQYDYGFTTKIVGDE